MFGTASQIAGMMGGMYQIGASITNAVWKDQQYDYKMQSLKDKASQAKDYAQTQKDLAYDQISLKKQSAKMSLERTLDTVSFRLNTISKKRDLLRKEKRLLEREGREMRAQIGAKTQWALGDVAREQSQAVGEQQRKAALGGVRGSGTPLQMQLQTTKQYARQASRIGQKGAFAIQDLERRLESKGISLASKGISLDSAEFNAKMTRRKAKEETAQYLKGLKLQKRQADFQFTQSMDRADKVQSQYQQMQDDEKFFDFVNTAGAISQSLSGAMNFLSVGSGQWSGSQAQVPDYSSGGGTTADAGAAYGAY